MKHHTLRGLRVALSLIIVFATGGGQGGELGLVVRQIGSIGPRQWLGLMAGSIVANSPVIGPLTKHITASSTGATSTS